MSLFNELKRRNVFRVAAAYIIVGWLIMQVGEVMAPALHLPGWINSALAFFIILGFPFALFFAWAFEMTPEGLKKEKDVDRSQSISEQTGQKLNRTLIALLALAVVYFALDKFLLDPRRDTQAIEAAVETAVQQNQGATTEPEATSDRSIAVLPFVNMSSDPEQEYFSDGITEELLNLLAKIPELRVAARTSSFSFKGQNVEIPVIADRLGVAHILEGSVRKAGDQIRITAQLIQAEDGFHLWSETYDRQMSNIFAIQDDISAAVVDALKVTLLGEAPRTRETDAEAYRLYLEAQYFFNQRSETGITRSVELLEEAVRIDPDYAPAWAELSYARMWVGAVGLQEPGDIMPLAKVAANRALELDPGYSLAHLAHAIHSMFYGFEFERGLAEYRRAWELDPGLALTNGGYGMGLRVVGRFDEALELQRKSVQLDPLSPEGYSNLGRTLEAMRRFDEAETNFRKVLELSPGYSGAGHRLARVELLRGDYDAALAEARAEIDDNVYGPASLAMAYHSLGEQELSDKALAKLIADGSATGLYQIAEVYAWRGQPGPAFEWLRKCREAGDPGLPGLLGDWFLQSLWDDPRWEAFLREIGQWNSWRAMPPEWGGPQE